MNARNQWRFKKFRFDEARLNLHCHRGDLRAKRLIVFVHGLNGGGYHTWGKFPQFVFDDPLRDPVDVALFDYFSGLRRRIFERPPVPVIAQILTERLQDLSKDYDEIFIIAHSLGGLISTDTLRNYIAQRDEEPGLLRVLAGAIFISTPWSGSTVCTRKDPACWYASGNSCNSIAHTNNNYVISSVRRSIRRTRSKSPHSDTNCLFGRSWVAAIGVVERSSATLGIDEDQIRTADVGHQKDFEAA